MSSLQGESLCLVESLRYEPGEGYFLLQRHLQRLERSARELGFSYDVASTVFALREQEKTLGGLSKVRLQLSRSGAIVIETQTISEEVDGRFAVAAQPLMSSDWALSHKTTQRTIYDVAYKSVGRDVDDVILWNERGELTETCRGNLVVQDGDCWLTPPLSSGLLSGTFRAELLSKGKIRESLLYVKDLTRWQALYRINSVRLWTRINLVA